MWPVTANSWRLWAEEPRLVVQSMPSEPRLIDSPTQQLDAEAQVDDYTPSGRPEL